MMKKYNTPEMIISMFEAETVATGNELSVGWMAYDEYVNDDATATTIDYRNLSIGF